MCSTPVVNQRVLLEDLKGSVRHSDYILIKKC